MRRRVLIQPGGDVDPAAAITQERRRHQLPRRLLQDDSHGGWQRGGRHDVQGSARPTGQLEALDELLRERGGVHQGGAGRGLRGAGLHHAPGR